MNKVKHYLSLVKFSHTIFAMPFALIGFFMGVVYLNRNASASLSGWEMITIYFKKHYSVFIGVILCMVFARSAAMAFNRYLDREFDAKNPRTAIREIPKGIISPQSALRFTLLNVVLFVCAAYMINPICFMLSPIALAVILGYSYTKRFTALCHVVLGLGLSLAPSGAFIAVTENIHLAVILLSFVVTGWVSGFDIIYSLQDDQFDRNEGLLSIPSALGRKKALLVSKALHAATVALLMGAGFAFSFGWLFWTGAAVFTLMLVYQQSIVKADDLSRVNVAFMTANGIASVVFSIFVIADLIIFS